MKPQVPQEYVQIQDLAWQPFPDAFSEGGIRWKLLHVSPEVGAWTAIALTPPRLAAGGECRPSRRLN